MHRKLPGQQFAFAKMTILDSFHIMGAAILLDCEYSHDLDVHIP